MQFPEMIGIIGAILCISGYLLLTINVLSNNSPSYYAINIASSILVFISLLYAPNIGAIIIQLFLFTISVLGILRVLCRNRLRWIAQ